MTINLLSTELTTHHTFVEWDIICNIITQFAYFETNKIKLVNKIFSKEIGELSREFYHTKNYLNLINDETRQQFYQTIFKTPYDKSLENHLTYLQKGGILNFKELNKITLLIESVVLIRKDFSKFNIKEFQELFEINLQSLIPKYLQPFRYLIDDSGEVDFDRHPELAGLSNRIREIEERIRRKLQDWMNLPQHTQVLQYQSYDVVFDRFVVPIRTDSYRSELGVIVSRSESGQTLFVEPIEVRDGCNLRIQLIAKIEEIINQLTLKFSRLLDEFLPILAEMLSTIQRIDFYLAKTAFSSQYKLSCPLIREEPGFIFSKIFHPLIKNAVSNDAVCNNFNSGIVISGPNTGGKTVFLKSVALSYLLFFHGFFVPAEDAQMYPYDGLFYFGNDLQNLQSGLSSFSGEVKNYLDLVKNILPTNLILIDEIFNSTSSDEASALSLAYFDELHKRSKCHIIVSTHHQMFKTLIHQDKDYISCHVGFDANLLKPTYKILWGIPGPSMAIEVFKLISKDSGELLDVPIKALSHLDSKNISYETLLQKVSQKEIELDHLLNSNKKLEIDLKNQKGSMQGLLNLRINEEVTKTKNELEKILHEARSLFEEIRKNDIKKMKKIDEKEHQLKIQIEKINFKSDTKQEENQPLGNLKIEQITKGDMVYSLVFKKDFCVQDIDKRKKEIMIAKGPIKISVPISTLTRSNSQKLKNGVHVSLTKSSNFLIEYDVRGMRLSEFQNIIEEAFSNLLSGDIPFLNIVHGHGDGILKNWLRNHLKKSNDFRGEIPENGNDGETKITLK
jgi:DNA mismatch repair protein MutS2